MIGLGTRHSTCVVWMRTSAAPLLIALGLGLPCGCHHKGVSDGNNNTNGAPGPCGEGWVLIPTGPFEMGVDADDPRFYFGAPIGSSPKVVVQMSGYCIQRTELSVASYRACVEAGVCEEPAQVTEVAPGCSFSRSLGDREDHPVTCVTWAQAQRYCQDWEGGHLPSEAQWEKAARGDSMDGRILPWGDAPVSCERANFDENGSFNEDTGEGSGWGCFHRESPATWPVGYLTSSKGDSPYGVKDLAGNVNEWTLDCVDRTFYARCAAQECVDPVDVAFDGCGHSARGDSARVLESNIDVITRGGPSGFDALTGFRCAKPPTQR